jgi:carbonic anhydrase
MTPKEVAVLRNAGGRAKKALKDILLLDSLLNISEIAVVHHTDCGGTLYKDEQIRAQLKEKVPGHENEIDSMYFGEIGEYVGSFTFRILYRSSVVN